MLCTMSNQKLIECVPNISEGRNKKIIDEIEEAIRTTPGVDSLSVDPGSSTHRTVYTFVGDPKSVVDGAINAAKVAFDKVDMTKHKGEHPRLGAMDVCPFIPVQNATMDDCVKCAEEMGRRLAEEVGVPAYLYGFASRSEHRKSVPQIRLGEYEGLKEKIQSPDWAPDFGEASFIPSWGATMVGARKFLLAYNINMLSTKEQAHRIALNLREAGRGPSEPGKFKSVQGIGWWLDESNMAQISLNLTDQDVTALHEVYEEAKKEAEALSLSVVGSELVGLVPLSAMLKAADYYIEKEHLMILQEDQKVRLAIDRLGLSSVNYFDPSKRIIEWKIREGNPPRVFLDSTVASFVHEVRGRKAAPGGGSVSALVGAMGSSLGSMVGLLTYGKRQWEGLDREMRSIIPPLHHAVDLMLPLVEADTNAFNVYVKVCKESGDKCSRAAQEALTVAIEVPLKLQRLIDSLWDTVDKVCNLGNPNCLSDLQVGVKCLETASFGAKCNVIINCAELADEQTRIDIIEESMALYQRTERKCSELLKFLDKKNHLNNY